MSHTVIVSSLSDVESLKMVAVARIEADVAGWSESSKSSIMTLAEREGVIEVRFLVISATAEGWMTGSSPMPSVSPSR